MTESEARRLTHAALDASLQSIFTRTIQNIDDAVIRLGLDGKKDAETVQDTIDKWFGPDILDLYQAWLDETNG